MAKVGVSFPFAGWLLGIAVVLLATACPPAQSRQLPNAESELTLDSVRHTKAERADAAQGVLFQSDDPNVDALNPAGDEEPGVVAPPLGLATLGRSDRPLSWPGWAPQQVLPVTRGFAPNITDFHPPARAPPSVPAA